VEMHPEAPNPHDSLGDAYMAAGRLSEAVESFQKAVALAAAADHPALSHYQKDLEKARRQAASQARPGPTHAAPAQEAPQAGQGH
jgi:tetratricopeptide (TPR) repeat protein